ncbi:hypothetical protein ACLB2K_042610 [Fragaria x ananassa]
MVDLDPTTPLKLDNQYYLNLQKKRGLLQSDQVLATDPGTVGFVNQLAGDNAGWSRKFVNAMERLGKELRVAGSALKRRTFVMLLALRMSTATVRRRREVVGYSAVAGSDWSRRCG